MEPTELACGQRIVEAAVRDEVARLGASLDSLEWGQDPDDFCTGQHLLVVIVNGRRAAKRFSAEDLSDAPATPSIRKSLAERVKSWLHELTPSHHIGFRPPPS
jgi:hypothetical protein